MKRFVLVILVCLLWGDVVYGKSINDLDREIDSLREEIDLYNYLSSDDVRSILDTSLDIEVVVDSLNEEINGIDKEISSLEEDILRLRDSIYDIMVFNQISEGENVYLEYIFNASSYSEMIYRYMMMEQITSYNNSLIEEVNEKILSLNEKREVIKEKIDKLSKERDKYRELEVVLKSVGSFTDDGIVSSIEEEIRGLEEERELYLNMGCSRDMDVSLCLKISDGKSFVYPLKKGCVTKDYSMTGHKGIDLACNREGTEVYSASLGVVSNVSFQSCGGNIVYIYHMVNGKRYTTIYGHLLEVLVKKGDYVDSDTPIGLVGGDSTSVSKGGYDRCSNGAHLHYVMVDGFHVSNFGIYTINPRFINNYPNVLDGYFMR